MEKEIRSKDCVSKKEKGSAFETGFSKVTVGVWEFDGVRTVLLWFFGDKG